VVLKLNQASPFLSCYIATWDLHMCLTFIYSLAVFPCMLLRQMSFETDQIAWWKQNSLNQANECTIASALIYSFSKRQKLDEHDGKASCNR